MIDSERLTETENMVPYGPLLEAGHLSAGLDYYKPTMSQLAYETEPVSEVTFTFHNRGDNRLADYVNPTDLQARFDQIRQAGFSEQELDYLASLTFSTGNRVFSDEYIGYLGTHELPEVEVKLDEETDDITIEATGPWALATFWETVVMSEVNEAYFEGYLRANDINPLEAYEEGDRRLTEKIAILRDNPDIKFADFGTRRHFSLRWHKYVLNRLAHECPDNFIGTSNVEFSRILGKKPIGTFAHEMPMVYAGLADGRGEDIRQSHSDFLNKWYERYGEDYSIALTDTFGSEFFFADFNEEQAELWRGVRHDSGDPFEFGEKVIEFYDGLDIPATEKTIVFSDGLDIETIVKLSNHFMGRVNVLFGWGTTLTNDLGIKPLNIVMKATHVEDPVNGIEADTVKLSDNQGKHTGPDELVHEYQENIFGV